MPALPRVLAALAFVAVAVPTSARADAPVGAHLACFAGKDRRPIDRPRAIDKPVTCQLVIDQGEPPPSAHAELTLTQDGRTAAPETRRTDQFVPFDRKDGIYYPFTPPFAPGEAFKACKPFDVVGRIVDGAHEQIGRAHV